MFPAVQPDTLDGLIVDMPNAYTMWAPMLLEINKFNSALNKASLGARKVPGALLSSVMTSFDAVRIMPSDYNPPEYTGNINTSAIATDQVQRSKVNIALIFVCL